MPRWFRLFPYLAVMALVAGCAEATEAPTLAPTEPPLPALITPLGQGGLPVGGDVSATPTPTPGDIPAGPTLPPAPSGTPAPTTVPTVVPPLPPQTSDQLPGGWIAYTASYYLDPNNVNPSTIACHLHVMSFDGSGDRDLTPSSAECAAAEVISPDGGWIAYLGGSARGIGAGMAGNVNVISVDGAQTRTFHPAPLSTGGLRWSKDGTKIAYYFQGDFQWHVIDAQTGAAIAAGPALAVADWYLPNLSPDGKYRAAYCEPDLREMRYRVCVTDLAVDTRPLGSNLDGGIAWSPDGGWVGYTVQDGLSSGDTSNDGTYLAHPDGTGAVRITTTLAGAIWFNRAP